jgi:hypothetical protein
LKDYIRIKLNADDNTGGLELSAYFQIGSYSGNGVAWFNASRVEEFALRLGEYPLPDGDQFSLAGGYWSKDRKGHLEEVHLSLDVYPIGKSGQVGAKIQLAEPRDFVNRSEAASMAVAELKTTYENLGIFSAQLAQLSRGDLDEVTLHGEELS